MVIATVGFGTVGAGTIALAILAQLVRHYQPCQARDGASFANELTNANGIPGFSVW